MADTAISGLTATTTVTDDDLFVVVDDPGGTPVTKKITAANLKASLGVGATGTGNSGYADAASSAATVSVTADGTAHTKGTWADTIMSTAHASDVLVVTAGIAAAGVAAAAADSSTLLDVGLWNGSSYDVLIENLLLGQALAGKTYVFNVAVPSGARLGARIQSATTSKSVTVHYGLRQAGSSVTAPTSVTTINANTATSSGIALTTVASINTKGAWTDLNGGVGVSAAYRKVVVGLAAINSTTVQAANGLVDVGLWNGSSYDVIIGDIGYSTNTSEQIVTNGNQIWFDVDIPNGAFLGARYAATSTNAAAKPHLALYCSP
jgi:hypothetical protein